MPRRNKRAPLPVLSKIDLTPVNRTWRVTLTNGSGFTTVDVDGTYSSAMEWAARAGKSGGIKAGRWVPTHAKALDTVQGQFNAV